MPNVVVPLTHKGKTLERVLSTSSETDRVIYVQDRARTNQRRADGRQNALNAVTTAKYSIFTFVPKNLLEQFRRVANIYFLVISLLQLTTTLSPTNKYSTIGPFVLVLLVTMIKEAIEDHARHVADKKVNYMSTRILVGNAFQPAVWQQVHVGDIVQVLEGESFPADLLMILSSNGDHAHVETSNLDGESNAKLKSCMVLPTLTLDTIKDFQGRITCDGPNPKLYRLDGVLQNSIGDATEEIPFTIDNVLLRGTSLCHSKWIIGVVLATGSDTKLMLNFKRPASKFSQIDRMANKCIVFLISVLLVLVTASAAAGTFFVRKKGGRHLYLGLSPDESPTFVSLWITYLILFNNLVPISLYITLEIVKWYQAKQIEMDSNLKCPETNRPAKAMTSNINEDLGQINFLFTDKTGTLTENQMVLRATSIGGCNYNHMSAAAKTYTTPWMHKKLEEMSPHDSPHILEFLRCVLLCHSATFDDQNGISSSSPDEIALLNGYLPLQCFLQSRKGTTIVISVFGQLETYQILACNEFDSQRRCMSVVVLREGKDTAKVYCKGADTVLLPASSSESVLGHYVHHFACLGLRTLVFAYRMIALSEVQSWLVNCKTSDKADDIGNIDEIEDVQKMEILGATGVEDKLQVGVSECIRVLSQAGIRVWMLTGDKDETAIAIGHACGLVHLQSTIMHINGKTKEECIDQITQHRRALKNQAIWNPRTVIPNLKIVLNGHSLETLIPDHMASFSNPSPAYFLVELLIQAKSVIASRLSPAQKAVLVNLVKSVSKRNITLAIGDGGNDVSMIQVAHVGVGIYGREGLQAVRSADFGLAQFRFLRYLLLLHGRWNHRRLMHVLLFTLYKNVVLVCTLALFSFLTGFSGQTLFDSYLIVGWNVVYTCLPVFVFGILDQDIQAKTILQYPKIYQEMEPINIQKCVLWLLSAIVHSTTIFYMVMKVIPGSKFEDGGVIFIGTVVFWLCLIAATAKAAVTMHRWHRWQFFHVGSLAVGIVFFILFVSIYSRMYKWLPQLNVFRDFCGLGAALWERKFALIFVSLVVPVAGVLPDFAFLIFQRLYLFSNRHVLQEIDSNLGSSFRTAPVPTTMTEEQSASAMRVQSLAELMETFPSSQTECELLVAQLQRLHATNRADPESELLDAKDARMHPTKLEFVGKQRLELESEFDASVVAQERLRVRYCVLIATCLLLISILVEYFFAKGTPSFLISRLAIVLGALAYAWFTTTSLFAKWYHMAILLPMAGTGVLISATMTGTGYVSAVLFPIVLLTLLHVRFIYAMGLVCVNYIIYATIQLFGNTLSAAELGSFTSYMIFVIGFAAHGCWHMQHAMRVDFLQHRSLAIEERRALKILSHVFPAHIMTKLKAGEAIISEEEPDVTILFCDVVELPSLLQHHPASEVVSLLDHIFSLFDEICVKYGVQKVETVGKTYVACAGLQESKQTSKIVVPPAIRVAYLASELLRLMKSCHIPGHTSSIKIRIGLHSGRVITGLVGRKKQQFSLFGDTVNTASRMQSTGCVGSCQVSEATYQLLKSEFEFTERNIFVKGKGDMVAYLLGSPQPNAIYNSNGQPMVPLKSASSPSTVQDPMYGDLHQQWLHFLEPEMEKLYMESTKSSRSTSSSQTLMAFCLYMLFAILRDLAIGHEKLRSYVVIAGMVFRGLFLIIGCVSVLWLKQLQEYICMQSMLAVFSLALYHILALLQNSKRTYEMHLDMLALDVVWVMFVVTNGGALIHRISIYFNAIVWGISISIFMITYLRKHESFLIYPLIMISCAAIANVTISRRIEFFKRRTLWVQTRAQLETSKADELLYQRLPPEVVHRMKQGEVVCDEHRLVGILYSDIQGFTSLASKAKTEEVIQMLDDLFASFDLLTDKHGVFKLQTIGDAYVIVSGLPYVDKDLAVDGCQSGIPKLLRQETMPRSPLEQLRLFEQARQTPQKKPVLRVDQHLQNLLQMALDMIHNVAQVKDPTTNEPLKMRIGIHLGSIYGGVIGNTTLRYDMWGSDAMIANEVESNGIAGRVVVSEAVKIELEEVGIQCNYHKDIQEHIKTYVVQLEPGQVVPRRSSPRKATSTVNGGNGSPGKLRKGY